ncbi:MAG: hypothetical protein VX777_06300 [Chlamydiota bacterium]|nr:hypothetical protein [Chlamydiota bacterium]
MDNISALEVCYKKYIKDLGSWLPEGVVDINLQLLYDMELLDYQNDDVHDSKLTRYFHVLETEEKITLINDDFVVWIVPEIVNEIPCTYTLIALNSETLPKLELAFCTSGVYNTSKLVLRTLEKMLKDIQENEEWLAKIKNG